MLPALLLAASAPVGLTPAGEVVVERGVVRVDDVARLEALAPDARARLAARVVARLPEGRREVTLSRAALAGLVRRAAPGLAIVLTDGGEPITLRRSEPAGAAGKGCFALSRPLSRDTALTDADIAAVPCDESGRAAELRFDRKEGVARAAADLAAGRYLGRVALRDKPAVVRGDRLTVAAMVGPVRIERRVEAMQAARSGQHIFVRDEDGQVFAAPLSIERNGEARP